jgi:ABC-type antimicrobial peptide transport system permease subunit
LCKVIAVEAICIATLSWVIPVVVIAVVASALPARGATRLTVREVLAYE